MGLLAQPSSPLIPIPDRPPPETEVDHFSSGIEGVPWSWALLKERTPRWTTTTNEYRISPPVFDKGKIETFESESIIGIVRAKLLDEERPIAVAPGKWFSGPIRRPKPPLPESSMHRGQWILLLDATELAPDIRPVSPVVAVASERLPRSMLLKASRQGSLIIADLSGFESEGEKYPIETLEHWKFL